MLFILTFSTQSLKKTMSQHGGKARKGIWYQSHVQQDLETFECEGQFDKTNQEASNTKLIKDNYLRVFFQLQFYCMISQIGSLVV